MAQGRPREAAKLIGPPVGDDLIVSAVPGMSIGTTAVYEGASLETTYGLENLSGLAVIPERHVAGRTSALP